MTIPNTRFMYNDAKNILSGNVLEQRQWLSKVFILLVSAKYRGKNISKTL